MTIVLALLLTTLPVSAASANGKLQNASSVITPVSSGQQANYDAYRYGSYIYYSGHGPYEGDNCANYIYRMKNDGTGNTKIATIKKGGSGWIQLVYGKTLVYTTSDAGSGTYATVVNLKTKKKKFIKNFHSHFQADYTLSEKREAIEPYHYKNYFVAATATGAVMERPLWIFDTKTSKPKTVTKKGWGIAIKGKKVYYLESAGSKIALKSCSLKGKNKKTLKTVKAKKDPSAIISSASGKACVFQVDGKTYKYKYKKK